MNPMENHDFPWKFMGINDFSWEFQKSLKSMIPNEYPWISRKTMISKDLAQQ